MESNTEMEKTLKEWNDFKVKAQKKKLTIKKI